MNTHIRQAWMMPKGAVFTALSWFVVGSITGFLLGHHPSIPRACTAPELRAHFLERRIAFNDTAVRSSSSESLRGAAPDENASASSTEPIAASGTSSSAASVSSAESASSSSSTISAGASASSSSVAREAQNDDFPAFDHATYPVTRVPNWGAMKTPAEWNRDYAGMDRDEFVRLPRYDLDDLTTPMAQLLKKRDDPESIRLITAKLFYSTRFFGSYDMDAGEFSGDHAGIDLKLPEGTPVASVAGGRVNAVVRDETGLGLHVVIEHRLGDETYYSIYGHLSAVGVSEGQDLSAGAYVGAVGSTGRSTSPHLHLQIDKGLPGELRHEAYWPGVVPSPDEAALHTVNPMAFIASHRL